ALNLGRAELEIGKYRDAVEHLRYCVPRLDASDPDLKLARGWLQDAEKKAAKIVIKVDVSSADVSVDDVLVGQAPLADPVIVDPGGQVVRAARGERSAARDVSVESGASASVEVQLPPEVT